MLLHLMCLKILHLSHDLPEYSGAVLRRITILDEADFYILFQLSSRSISSMVGSEDLKSTG